MGNAFFAGLKNEAPRGKDITKEDRNSEVSQRATERDAEGSEFSYTITYFFMLFHFSSEVKSHFLFSDFLILSCLLCNVYVFFTGRLHLPVLNLLSPSVAKNQYFRSCRKNYAILSKFCYFFPILQQTEGDYPQS